MFKSSSVLKMFRRYQPVITLHKLLAIILLLPFVVQCFSEIPTVLLNNGVRIPILGLGTSRAKSTEVIQAVKDAIDVGYRHLDCAPSYKNEKEIGQAIAELIAEGVVKREDLFIVSKLGNIYHKPQSVESALNITLNDLGLGYVDLYLIHFPIGYTEDRVMTDDDYVDTWKAMEAVYKKGLARSIGVSNFNKAQIERILNETTVVPVTNQVECHPRLNQKKLIDFCKSKNITITAFRPLGSIEVTDKPTLLDDSTINRIAKKLNRTPAQILLKFQVQRGVITIPKSTHKARIAENSMLFDFELSDDDMREIEGLDDVHGRIGVFPERKHHKYYPFSDEY